MLDKLIVKKSIKPSLSFLFKGLCVTLSLSGCSGFEGSLSNGAEESASKDSAGLEALSTNAWNFGSDRQTWTDEPASPLNAPEADQVKLAAAFAAYKNLIDYYRPKVKEQVDYAGWQCTSKNPQHHSLATGEVRRSLGDFLSYESSSLIDIGMGPGVYPSHLVIAFLVPSSQGDRVVVLADGKVSQMLPLENYRGSWPHWPKKEAISAKIRGNVIELRSSPHVWSIYTKAKEDVFFLTSTHAPYNTTVYEYDQDGLKSRLPMNACHQPYGERYTYKSPSPETSGEVGRQLLAVHQIKSAAILAEYSYYDNNRIKTFSIFKPGQPKVGGLKNTFFRRIRWNMDQRVESIFDEKNSIIEGFTYYRVNGSLQDHSVPVKPQRIW